MAAFITSDLQISYGGVIAGGASDYLIDSERARLRLVHSYEAGFVEFDVILQPVADDDAAFKAAVDILENAYRVPNADLIITFGTQTFNYRHSLNEALNTRPTIVKAGEELIDSHLCRHWTLRIDFALPADEAGKSGRQSSEVSVGTGPQDKRLVEIVGVYTALGANAATIQHDASVTAYATSVLSALGGTFKLLDSDRVADDEDKIVTFSRIYEEEMSPTNPLAGTTDATIIGQSVQVTQVRIASEGSPLDGAVVAQLAEYRVAYFAFVTVAGGDLENKWRSGIRPWILGYLAQVFNASGLAITAEAVEIDPDARTIRADVVAIGSTRNGGQTVAYAMSIERGGGTSGFELHALHGENAFAKYLTRGPAQRTLRYTRALTLLGHGYDGFGAGFAFESLAQFGFDNNDNETANDDDELVPFLARDASPDEATGRMWVPVQEPQETITPKSIGFVGEELAVTEFLVVETWELADIAASTEG